MTIVDVKPVFIMLFALSMSYVSAQTCCSGGIPLSNNLGLENIGKNNLQLGINYDFNNLNTLNAGDRRLDDDSRKRTTHSILFNAAYSITNNLSVETLLTWVNQRRRIDQFGNVDLQATTGLGDAVVLAKYGFLNAMGTSSDITLGVGAKVPLGSYEEANDIGITYIADLQPGSGAWDLILYTSLSKNFGFRPSTTFSARMIYRATGKNKDYLEGLQTYEYGNEVQLFFGISDEFVIFKKQLISPNIMVKYRNARKDEIDSVDLSNTGGNWIFLIPGLSLKFSKNISFITRAEIPVSSNVDGTQLTPTYRLTSGFLIHFNLKKKTLNFNNSQL